MLFRLEKWKGDGEGMLPWAHPLHCGQNVGEKLKGVSAEIHDVHIVP